MKGIPALVTTIGILIICSCHVKKKTTVTENSNSEFAPEVTEFTPYPGNPLFKGTGSNTWDKDIRERGYILLEDGIYKMWYTGYQESYRDTSTKHLGYATSTDGIHWSRYPGNPIFRDKWTEDMNVVKYENKYYMFAEGKHDVAHLLISTDGIQWQEQGDLEIKKTTGDVIPGPYGTPTAWVENGKWYLFYEVNDEGIWLAQSTDARHWKNLFDEPVIKKGPGKYDIGAVAANQVIKYKGRYYIYYHASDAPMVSANVWTSNVASSTDLIHWVKYPKNPISQGDRSSPITVFDGKKYRLYTMHREVCLYFSK